MVLILLGRSSSIFSKRATSFSQPFLVQVDYAPVVPHIDALEHAIDKGSREAGRTAAHER